MACGTPDDLAEAAKCLANLPANTLLGIIVSQLCGDSCDPDALAEEAKCLSNMPTNVLLGIIARTLCEGTVFSCGPQSGAGSPVGSATPDFVGQLYHDTDADTYWRSTGLTDADWTEISGGSGDCIMSTVPAGNEDKFGVFTFGDIPGVTDFVWNGTTTLAGFDLESAFLVSVSFPNLISIDPASSQGGYLYITSAALMTISAPSLVVAEYLSADGSPLVTTLDFPSLTTVNDTFQFALSGLTSLNLPNLSTVGNELKINTASLLSVVSFPVLTDVRNVELVGNALNAASMNGVLATLVAIPTWGNAAESCDMSGGTSAGTGALTVQGAADVATLTGRGATITLNP